MVPEKGFLFFVIPDHILCVRALEPCPCCGCFLALVSEQLCPKSAVCVCVYVCIL